jgi:hypothetical protein
VAKPERVQGGNVKIVKWDQQRSFRVTGGFMHVMVLEDQRPALVLGAIGIELADRLTFDAPLRETKAKIGFVVDLWFC